MHGHDHVVRRSIAILVLAAGTAHAEPTRVSLAQALAAADQAPAAQAAADRGAVAGAEAEAAGPWPVTTLTGGTTWRTTKFFGAVSIPLPITGQPGAARRTARAQAEVARAEAAGARLELRLQVTVAWLDLSRAQALAAVVADTASRARELERAAKIRLDVGDVPAADVESTKASRIRADVEARAAQAEIGSRAAALAGLLGWDPAGELVADGSLPDPAPPPELTTLRSRLPRNPTARAAASAVAAASSTIDEANRARWPGLALDFELDVLDRRGDPDDARAALVLELPLFGRTGAKVGAARAGLRLAEAEARAASSRLDGELVAAHRRAATATERAIAFEREVLPAQERAADLAVRAYREGAADLASALVADRELLAVRAEVIDAVHAAAVAHAELDRATGAAP